MIQWVYEKASAVLPQLVVATDDSRIKEAVEGFGGTAVMTSSHHETGTERCAEALELFRQMHPGEITHVINIQGDEPLLIKEHLEALMGCFNQQQTQIATLIQPVQQADDLGNPNLVKVVVNKSFRALYFSRAPIPYIREPRTDEDPGRQVFYTHIGLYAYNAGVLAELVHLPASNLERSESLEQLRWIYNGYEIQTVVTDQPTIGVDTPEDLERIGKLI